MSTTRGQHLIGKTIGSCVIEKLLGYGGSSAVFLAQQIDPAQKVAIKVFLPHPHMEIQIQKDFYRRFLREAEAASQLDHPNILPIYSYGQQDGLPYIIMPYMSGGTLHEYITRSGCLSLNEAQWYLEQIASALDYAHQEHGCVHCDVKPANILLDSNGSVVLSDFGIVYMMREVVTATSGQPGHAESSKQPSTRPAGMLMGTPDYISPEQALGQPLDGRSDIYSLGIMLYYLLAGHVPFHAESTIATALLHVHEIPPVLSLIRADITPHIDHVILKAIAKRPEDRFQTASEFSTALAQAIQISDKAYQIDPDQKPVVLGDEDLNVLSSSIQRDLRKVREARPVVRVRPASQAVPRLLRIMIAIMVLLTITVGAALLGGMVTLHLDSRAHNIPAIHLTVPANIVADDLANNKDWPTGGAFFFSGDQYHIQNKLAHNVALALYADHQYSNFHLSVTMTELHGTTDGADYYGVAFRGSADQSHYYLFEVVGWDGGQYQFLRYDGDAHWKTLAYGRASSFRPAIGKNNTLVIDARGQTFTFFINGKPAGSPITDSSKSALSSGEVGFSVEEQGTEVGFSHLYIGTSK